MMKLLDGERFFRRTYSSYIVVEKAPKTGEIVSAVVLAH